MTCQEQNLAALLICFVVVLFCFLRIRFYVSCSFESYFPSPSTSSWTVCFHVALKRRCALPLLADWWDVDLAQFFHMQRSVFLLTFLQIPSCWFCVL